MLLHFFTVASALLLSACALDSKIPPAQTPSSPPPTPKNPEDSYRTAFGAESLAGPMYEELYQAGVDLHALDRGCHHIDFTKSNPEGVYENQKGVIESCEVFQYVLDHSDQFRSLAERLSKGNRPWDLDDHNPATDFDAKVRAKVSSGIETLKSLLVKQGLKPESAEYQEKMAVGLYYLVVYPRNPLQDPGIPNWQYYGAKELFSIGLQEFHRDFLQKHGGLGRITAQGSDEAHEFSALEAIEKNQGWCTEWSKVLYGAHQMAGLKSFFVYTRLDPKSLPSESVADPDTIALDHILVGLPLGSKVRFFDVARYDPDIRYHRWYHYKLLDYLAEDLSNRGVDQIKNKKNLSAATADLKLALELNPKNFGANFNLGMILFQQGDAKGAAAYFDQAVRIDPTYFLGYAGLGRAQAELGQYDQAILNFNQAIKLSPEQIESYLDLGMTYVAAKKPIEARQVFQRALQLDPNNSEAESWLKKINGK